MWRRWLEPNKDWTFLQRFKTIVTEDQRKEYKEVFDQDYIKYCKLLKVLHDVGTKFINLGLDQAKEAKRNFLHLHQKLKHINHLLKA